MALRKYSAVRGTEATHSSDGFTVPRNSEQGGLQPPAFTISATEGESASATISGTYPNFHISLVLPRGEDGDDGIDGTDGVDGVCNCDCDCCDDPDCPPAGTVITPQYIREDVYHYTSCSPMTKGYRLVDIVADGNCGQQEGQEYFQWNVGDIGSCEGYIYSVDGSGNVTSRWDDGGGGGTGPITCPTGYHDDGFGNCVPD
jgi:hypothetical protein